MFTSLRRFSLGIIIQNCHYHSTYVSAEPALLWGMGNISLQFFQSISLAHFMFSIVTYCDTGHVA